MNPTGFPSSIPTGSPWQQNDLHPVFDDEEILLKIFFHTVHTTNSLQQIYTLSLVSRNWSVRALNPFLWKTVSLQVGIPLPLNENQTRLACRYEKSSLLLDQVIACKNPIIETIDLDTNFYGEKVQFIEDRYLIANNERRVTIYDLKEKSIVNRINTSQLILAVCSGRDKIHICRESGEIDIYALLPKSENHQPLVTLVGHKNEFGFRFAQLLSFQCTDQWLISHSNQTIQQWSLENYECVSVLSGYVTNLLNINQNKLYRTRMIGNRGTNFSIFCADLNECNLEFRQLPYDTTACNPSIQNSTIFYLEDISEYEEEEFEVIAAMVTINLYTAQKKSLLLGDIVNKSFPSLRIINDLAIVIEDYINEEGLNTNVLHLIDLTNQCTTLFSFKNFLMYNNLLQIFQNSFLFLNTSADRVIKITFSESLHHKEEAEKTEGLPPKPRKRTAEEFDPESSPSKKTRL